MIAAAMSRDAAEVRVEVRVSTGQSAEGDAKRGSDRTGSKCQTSTNHGTLHSLCRREAKYDRLIVNIRGSIT